jgi:hypothetical protein
MNCVKVLAQVSAYFKIEYTFSFLFYLKQIPKYILIVNQFEIYLQLFISSLYFLTFICVDVCCVCL